MGNPGDDVPFEADPLSEIDFDASPKLILNANGELVVAPPEEPAPPPEPAPPAPPQRATFAHLLEDDGLVIAPPVEAPPPMPATAPPPSSITDDLTLEPSPASPDEDFEMLEVVDEPFNEPLEEVVGEPNDHESGEYALELTEDDVVETHSVISTRPQSHLSRASTTVTPVAMASSSSQEAPAVVPRRAPSVLGRKIRERSRQSSDPRLGAGTSTNDRAEPFFQRGIRALEAGDLVNAERDIALALSYAPSDPRYRQAFQELKRQKGR